MAVPSGTQRLRRDRRRALSALGSELAHAAAIAPDELALGDAAARHLGPLFGAERVSVLVDAPDGERRLVGAWGESVLDAEQHRSGRSLLLERARAAGHALRWTEADDDGGTDDPVLVQMLAAGRRSAMVAPVLDVEGIRGSVHVSAVRPSAFDDEDVRLLEHGVAMLAAGLARIDATSRLRDAVAHAREVATRVHRLGPLAETLAGCNDESTVLRATTSAVKGLFLAERGGIALVEDGAVIIHEQGEDPDAPELRLMGRVPFASSVVSLIQEQGLDHLDERHGDPHRHPEVAALRAAGMRSWCIAPIRESGRIVGTVNVASARTGQLDADEVELVHSLARLIGATLARIHAGQRAEVETRGREERLQELADRLEEQTVRDPLTDLRNRRGFERVLEERLLDDGGVLAFCDLDHFKVVNDREGYHVGDRVLREVSGLLVRSLPPEAVIGRLGGDEFGVLFPDADVVAATGALAAARAAVAAAPFPAGTTHYRLGLSAGVVRLDGSLSVTDAVAAADTACHQAKEAGRDRVRVFHSSDRDTRRRRREMAWTTRISAALRDDRLVLHAQPIIHLGTSAADDVVHRYELLLRMHDEAGRIVPPADFLPAADRFDLAPRVDRWVVEQALALLASRPELRWSVNLSPRSVADAEFGEWIVDAVRRTAPRAGALALEVTETAVVRDLDVAAELLEDLRRLGCRAGLDDFGSGVASLGYLRRLPVDTVKLDGTLVREADRDPDDHAVLAAIAELARALGMRVIAEHVSRPSLLEMVRALGIGGAQGFALGRPEPVADILARHRASAERGRAVAPPA